jgi:hypothetical protein
VYPEAPTIPTSATDPPYRIVHTHAARSKLDDSPGCKRHAGVHAHHVVHWARGGPTTLENLIELCSYHHHLVHEGGWTVEILALGEVRFRRPDGRPAPNAPPALRGDVRVLVEAFDHLGIDPETCQSRGQGESFDLSMAIDALLWDAGLTDGVPTTPDEAHARDRAPAFN